MIGKRWNLRFLVSVMAVTAIALVACSSNDPDPTAVPTNAGGQPIFFPYVFSGKFTVAGEPGPQGVPMFARLGDDRGLFNDSIRPGEYINVSVAPENADAIGKEITFHLGNPDGPTVQADETWIYSASAQPQLLELDLTFPRLP